jgi:N-acetylmuramoyl-L-alanine amidase
MVSKTLLSILVLVTFAFGDAKVNSLLSQLKKTSSKHKLIKIHNSLKNIYIQSIIKNKKPLQITTLKALVKSSKVLKLDYEHYTEELNLLAGKKTSTKKTKVVTTNKYKHSKNQTVIKVENNDHQIVLHFNKPLKKDSIKTFELNKKNKTYKDVFDIEGKLAIKPNNLHIKGLKRVAIAQFKPTVVRLVLEGNKAINSNFSIENKKIIISTKIKQNILQEETIFVNEFKNKTIIIDPGHGGKDPGAVGYKKMYEKKAMLNIAQKLKTKLRDRGYKVFLTRYNDNFIGLKNRTKVANDKKADIFISIHANAAPHKKLYNKYKGIETYFLSPARSDRDKEVAQKENMIDLKAMDDFSQQTFLNFLSSEKIVASNKLAIDIQKGMISSVKRKYNITDGGVRVAPFWVLVGAQMPSVLVEVGYITNPKEARLMLDNTYTNDLTNGIADGVDGYFIKNK